MAGPCACALVRVFVCACVCACVRAFAMSAGRRQVDYCVVVFATYLVQVRTHLGHRGSGGLIRCVRAAVCECAHVLPCIMSSVHPSRLVSRIHPPADPRTHTRPHPRFHPSRARFRPRHPPRTSPLVPVVVLLLLLLLLSAVGAKRVLHEVNLLTPESSGKFINCEDGLEIPW